MMKKSAARIAAAVLELLFLNGVASSVYAATSSWAWRAPLPQGNNLLSVASSANCTVAVGDHGVVLTKSGSGTWVASRVPVDYGLGKVTWTGSLFVAAGQSSSSGFYSSPDGTTWQTIPGTTDNGSSFIALVSSPTKTVGMRWDGEVWSSSDTSRQTWTKTTLPTIPLPGQTYSGTYSSMAYGNGTFVAAGSNGTIVTSQDGTSWAARTTGTTIDLYSVAFNGTMFGARGNSYNSSTGKTDYAYLTSIDGLTWTKQPNPVDASGNPLIYGNNLLRAGSRFLSDSGNKYVSSDLVTWTSLGNPAANSNGIMNWVQASSEAGGGKTILVGSGGRIYSLAGDVFTAEVDSSVVSIGAGKSAYLAGLNAILFT